MKELLAALMMILAACWLMPAMAESAAPSVTGPLKVTGTRLTDAGGSPIQLRGVSTHGLAWYPGYVNQTFFHQLKQEFGCNAVRLSMYTAENGGYCTNGDPRKLKQLVLDGVEYARQADLYAIVDWHILSDGNPNTYLDEALAFFGEISAALAGQDHVLYEICNEPNGCTWQDIKAYAEKVIPVIRANDPDAVIIVGTPTWSQRVDQAAADPITGWDNLMYALHFYAATHGQWLRDIMTGALDSGLPVIVSEYGLCAADGNGVYDFASGDQWADLLDARGISYMMWGVSNKRELCAIIRPECKATSGLTWNDLTEAGRWLVSRLGGTLAGETASSAGENEASGNTGNLCRQERFGGWIDYSSGADADLIIDGSAITVHVRQSTSDNYRVQPSCDGITLERGRTYVLSFTISCTRELTLDARLQQNYGSYSGYHNLYSISMGPEPQTYTAVFTMNAPTDDSVALVFNIGGRGKCDYTVSISGISLTGVR